MQTGQEDLGHDDDGFDRYVRHVYVNSGKNSDTCFGRILLGKLSSALQASLIGRDRFFLKKRSMDALFARILSALKQVTSGPSCILNPGQHLNLAVKGLSVCSSIARP